MNGVGAFLPSPTNGSDLEWTITPPTMMVGYQGLEDGYAMREIAEYYKREFGGVLGVGSGSLEGGGGDDKVRVGFASAFFMSHSVGRLMVGVIEGLDKERFEVRGRKGERG